MKIKIPHNVPLLFLKDTGIITLTILTGAIFLLVPAYFTIASDSAKSSTRAENEIEPPAIPARVEESEFTLTALPVTFAMQTLEPDWYLPEIEATMCLPGPTVLPPKKETALTNSKKLPSNRSSKKKIPFHEIIDQVAGRYHVDPHLIRAIIFAESGYNPKAKSKKGARGLMQLMPSTAESLGVRNIYDPEENIDGGVRYFRTLLNRFGGDIQLALAAYNAGSRHVRNYEGVPPFKATQRYIKKVLKFHKKFKAEMDTDSQKLA